MAKRKRKSNNPDGRPSRGIDEVRLLVPMLSKSTQNRKWAAFFRAEDALKATAQGVAR